MLPKVNQFLYMQVASPDRTEASVEYKTRIADAEDGHLLIDVPIQEQTGTYKRLYLGDELSAYFLTQDGVKHYFNSHVSGFKEDVVKLIRIRMPDPASVTKVQRRSFLRVGAELELAVKMEPHVKFVCLTDDVGGGGVSFLAERKWPLREGAELGCWILLPYRNGSLEHAQFKAEVVRIKGFENGKNQVMAKFADITDGERQKIIRFCFERQLDIRKN